LNLMKGKTIRPNTIDVPRASKSLGDVIKKLNQTNKVDDFKPKLKLDLDGPDGNAFMIMALCRRTAREAGWDADKIKKFLKECQSSTYDHLLETVHNNFDVY